MPIMSYLAYPQEGKMIELKNALSALPGCQVIPASNRNVVVLVTDTQDEITENELQEHLKLLPSLQFLGLVSGIQETNAME